MVVGVTKIEGILSVYLTFLGKKMHACFRNLDVFFSQLVKRAPFSSQVMKSESDGFAKSISNLG